MSSRIGKAWIAVTKLSIICKSTVNVWLNRNFFRATVETVLLYGSVTWILTKKLENKLDGTYTRMLRSILNKCWQDHPTNAELYGNIPPISHLIRERIIRYAGHCYRREEEIMSKVILWNPYHGKTKVGRPHNNFLDQLKNDVDMDIGDISMNGRDV